MNVYLAIGIFLCGAGAGALLTKIACLEMTRKLRKEIGEFKPLNELVAVPMQRSKLGRYGLLVKVDKFKNKFGTY